MGRIIRFAFTTNQKRKVGQENKGQRYFARREGRLHRYPSANSNWTEGREDGRKRSSTEMTWQCVANDDDFLALFFFYLGCFVLSLRPTCRGEDLALTRGVLTFIFMYTRFVGI